MATHLLWKKMDPQRVHEILLSVQEGNKKLYRTTVEIMAPHIGMRPVKVLEMPKTERHAAFAQLLAKPALEELSFNLISTWLMHTQKELLSAWLDALQIPHDGSGCANTFPPCPDKTKLQQAVEKLLSQFEPRLVALYLRTFNEIDEVRWQPLAEILDSDKRLQNVA
jgi:hypothetical protein